MTDYIRVVAELSISEGKIDEFKKKAAAFIERVEANEPDTLSFELFLSDDESKCYTTEKYEESEALMAHLGNIGDLLGPIFEIAPLTGLMIFGSPSDELRQALAPLSPTFFEHWNGFTR